MRRPVFIGAGFAGLVALFAMWRTRGEVADVVPAEQAAPAPLAARIVVSAAPPTAPPERTRGATMPQTTAREPHDANEVRFTALQQAVGATTPEAARLYADFAKVGLAMPAEARTLAELKQRGARHDDMVAYIRASFPDDVIARAVALRWLDGGAAGRPRIDANVSHPVGGTVTRDRTK